MHFALGRTVVSVYRDQVTQAGTGFPHGGPVALRVANGAELTVDEIFVALGRTPGTGDIGLSSVGLPDGGYLAVDDQQTVKGVSGQ
ncbi:hypothetical protein [Streptacidiphilus rugosus]|uniref:hypothetical protein n=1 Tax=Streptacidiphilus rugosus TaxID=405783 RepID=UPI00068DB3AB|nr:hypothetical protein [Streptacidiphilus rugosus]